MKRAVFLLLIGCGSADEPIVVERGHVAPVEVVTEAGTVAPPKVFSDASADDATDASVAPTETPAADVYVPPVTTPPPPPLKASSKIKCVLDVPVTAFPDGVPCPAPSPVTWMWINAGEYSPNTCAAIWSGYPAQPLCETGTKCKAVIAGVYHDGHCEVAP